MTDENKNATIIARVKPSQKAKLLILVKQLGYKNVSHWMRDRIDRARIKT